MSNYCGKDPSPELFPVINTTAAPRSHYLLIFATSLLRKSLFQNYQLRPPLDYAALQSSLLNYCQIRHLLKMYTVSLYHTPLHVKKLSDRKDGAHKIRKK